MKLVEIENRLNKVSVILPVYNGENYIEECVNSIKNQRNILFELIVIDDCSTDNTLGLLKKFKKAYDFKLIKLRQNKGQGYCRNIGIKNSKFELIAFIDADDIWQKDKLFKQVKFHLDNEYEFTYTNYSFINSEGNMIKSRQKFIKRKLNYNDLLLNNYVCTSTVMVNRSIIKDIEFKNLRKKQDYVFWLDILKKYKINAHLLNECLTCYRKHKNQTTSKKNKLVKLHYETLRNTQDLSVVKAIYYTITWAVMASIKHFS